MGRAATTLYYLLYRSASLAGETLFHRASIRVDALSAMQKNIPHPNPHLPPDLAEIGAILAAGLLRLRSRTAEERARHAAESRGHGDIRLHSTAPRRRHATRTNRRLA
jgi:hypothetical protein